MSDSEGLTTLPDGRFAVAFDLSSKILVYGDDSNPKRIDLPPNVNALTGNRGVEALALDLEGRLIAIPEPVPKQAPGVPV
ncbi:esterase-like activity of phytase family protein [uncultured Boseongicola sp.]|uniref:esterase-like activity of phytase family protein n=1 Tax=uncultured Boseongicola sp. TaxID=1648499 RepID=UPI00343D100F